MSRKKRHRKVSTTRARMFCRNCGRRINAKSRFCKFCGVAVGLAEKEEIKREAERKFKVEQVLKTTEAKERAKVFATPSGKIGFGLSSLIVGYGTILLGEFLSRTLVGVSIAPLIGFVGLVMVVVGLGFMVVGFIQGIFQGIVELRFVNFGTVVGLIMLYFGLGGLASLGSHLGTDVVENIVMIRILASLIIVGWSSLIVGYREAKKRAQ